MKKFLSPFLVCLALSVTAQAAEDEVVTFRDRQINLGSFLDAFPYDPYRWVASVNAKVLYYMKSVGNKQIIHVTTLNASDAGPVTIDSGRPAAARDFATSLTFNWKVNDANGHLFFTADEGNNEKFNLHSIDPSTGEVKKWSDVNYVADFGFSPDYTKVAYSDRTGVEGARYKIHVIDLATGGDRVIAADDAEQQFTWNRLSWRPSSKGVVLTTLTKGDRTKGNISYIDVTGDESQRPVVLTDASTPRSFPSVGEKWLNENEFTYLSNEKGANNLYVMNVETKASRQLTQFGSDVVSFFVDSSEGQPYILFTVLNPLVTKVYRLLVKDRAEPELFFEEQAAIALLDLENGEALYQRTSADDLQTIASFNIAAPAASKKPRAVLDPAVVEKIIHCDTKAVQYDTFDKVPMVLGETALEGKIHAYLYSPKKPLPKDEGMVVIESFYGGANKYHLRFHIFCAAGIHVLSPAARGGAVISADFEKLNDGDLGGKEVLDVMYGARFASATLGIPAQRIGVWGHSHGGYEVMRQLTVKDEIAPGAEMFPWGFGMAEAGFSSIKEEYDFSNIKQWIAKEAGDPAKEGVLEFWEQRSPINSSQNLEGKLLLVHGTNDQRVPYASSKNLYTKLQSEGKGDLVKFHSVEGAGHVFTTRKDQVELYKAEVNFLGGIR